MNIELKCFNICFSGEMFSRNSGSGGFVTLPDFRKLCDAVSRTTSLPGNFVPVHSTKHRVSLIERKHFNYYRKDICKGECEL